MPTLEIAAEFSTCVENLVVVLLVMHGPCQTVPKHAFRQGWQ